MTSLRIPPFLTELPKWKDVVRRKHILFDTDAIVSILSFKAEDVFVDLKNVEVVNCFIHPVYVELFSTKRSIERASRLLILNNYKFRYLPLTKREFDNARRIQLWLTSRERFPAPTDLYLGGTLASFKPKSIFLLTGNISDFQHPLFKREAGIVLQSNKQSRILSFLSIDHSELGKVELESR